MADTKPKNEIFYVEGRLINHALFERDAYQKDEKSAPGKPMYKVELACDEAAVMGEGTIEDKLADAVEAKWGATHAQGWLNGDRGYWSPLLSGDTMAAERAAKGKEGDAYKSKVVIRANTSFNKEGKEDVGGIAVYDADTSAIGFAEKSKVYNGCHGIAAVTISAFEAANKDKGVKFYLVAFQKTADGEPLTTASDKSTLFKPVGNVTPITEGRRRRGG